MLQSGFKTFLIRNNSFYHLVLAAIQSLKRKKRYEKQLTQIDGQISTLEFQKEALENASSNADVLRCMGAAQHALKTSDVHDLSDE